MSSVGDPITRWQQERGGLAQAKRATKGHEDWNLDWTFDSDLCLYSLNEMSPLKIRLQQDGHWLSHTSSRDRAHLLPDKWWLQRRRSNPRVALFWWCSVCWWRHSSLLYIGLVPALWHESRVSKISPGWLQSFLGSFLKFIFFNFILQHWASLELSFMNFFTSFL